MKILHIVYQSFPNISGSSVRTRDIIISQQEYGLNPIIVSSPFQDGISNEEYDTINNIKHYRTYNNKPEYLVSENKTSLFGRIRKSLYIFSFYKKVKQIVKKEKPEILHAHATFFCAIVAIILGRKYDIPVCYEVRSLWEEREKKEANNFLKRLQPKIIYFIETQCMLRSDMVITINENLKKEIIRRGIKNISVVANAVNYSLIKADRMINSSKQLTFGYVGSVSPIEGLDLIVKLWAKLEKEGFNNNFHIYGNGTFLNTLKELKERLGVTNVIFKGRIESHKVVEAYNEIDVIINPRVKSKISDTVTPLKPLEAMAYNKLVIASNVGGMQELIEHKFNGLLFESDSLEALEFVVKEVIENGLDIQLINRANNYIKENRSWTANTKIYHSLYKGLIS